MGARLLALAALAARRYGPVAAARLARAVRAWIANPSNAAARAELEGQLASWAGRAAGSVSDTAGRLMTELERRRRMSVPAWERELIGLRMDLAMSHGPEREAVLTAYAEGAEGAVVLVAEAQRPADALRDVLETFRAERAMLAGDLPRADRDRAVRALDRVAAACRRAVAR